jgi:hypothetical protein
MRSINATLKSAMTNGSGTPVIRFYQQSTGGADQHIYNVIGYELKGLELHVKIEASKFVKPSQLTGYLTRGLSISGVEYLLPTNYYAIRSVELNDSFAIFHCHILNGNNIVAIQADIPTNTLLSNLAGSNFQNLTPIYNVDYTEAWTGFQFAPQNQLINLADNTTLESILMQKYCCYISAHNDIIGAASAQKIKFFSTYWRAYNLYNNSNPTVKNITALKDLHLSYFNPINRSWIWTDELKNKYRQNGSNYRLHNLGYMPSTATWPYPTNMPNVQTTFQCMIYPDFELQDGDNISLTTCGQAFKTMIKIAERFNWGGIPWHMELSQIDIVPAGGQTTSYTPYNTVIKIPKPPYSFPVN